MSETISPLHTVSIYETPSFFFATVVEPFEEDSEGFGRFDFMAHSTHVLKGGSQVFVYRRKDFGRTSQQQQREVIDFVNEVAEEAGSMAVHQTIKSLPEFGEK